jgi:hypothetical protein
MRWLIEQITTFISHKIAQSRKHILPDVPARFLSPTLSFAFKVLLQDRHSQDRLNANHRADNHFHASYLLAFAQLYYHRFKYITPAQLPRANPNYFPSLTLEKP